MEAKPKVVAEVEAAVKAEAESSVYAKLEADVDAFVKIGEKWTFADSKWFRQCWTKENEGRG